MDLVEEVGLAISLAAIVTGTIYEIYIQFVKWRYGQ